MSDSQKRAVAYTVLVAAQGLLLAACGVGPEQSVLDHFFAASRLRDKTALAKFATVTFEPLQQGIVTEYKIDRIVSERDTKRVSLSAHVKRPDGQVVSETLFVVMERDPIAGWKVTGLIER